ncbi:MAG: hypothetical protein JSU07_08570 [Bacteroidetes bacterium]|nr:hypothetical protein [Bacteroidota bacterium]
MSFFVFAGLGGFYMDPKLNTSNGTSVTLDGMSTEGKSYSHYQICIPFGIGYKWNIFENWGLSIEWGPRKTFTSYLDDVNGTYPTNPSLSQQINANAVKFQGDMRGRLNTKDWYFYYGMTLNFRLPKKGNVCQGVGEL